MSEENKAIDGAADAQTTTKDAEEAAPAGQSQSGEDPNQEQTNGGSAEDPPSPDIPKAKGGKKDGGKGNPEAPKAAAPKAEPQKPTQVRVILEEGTLGPQLLVKGDVTSDPKYVAILNQKGQKKVELVK